MDELRTPTWSEAQALTNKQLNEALRRHGKRGYSSLKKAEKLSLLTGQQPPEDYVPRKMPEALLEYNSFRSKCAKEWDCNVINATKRIKAAGLWDKVKAEKAAVQAQE